MPTIGLNSGGCHKSSNSQELKYSEYYEDRQRGVKVSQNGVKMVSGVSQIVEFRDMLGFLG